MYLNFIVLLCGSCYQLNDTEIANRNIRTHVKKNSFSSKPVSAFNYNMKSIGACRCYCGLFISGTSALFVSFAIVNIFPFAVKKYQNHSFIRDGHNYSYNSNIPVQADYLTATEGTVPWTIYFVE